VITHKVLGDALPVLAHELVVVTRVAAAVHWGAVESREVIIIITKRRPLLRRRTSSMLSVWGYGLTAAGLHALVGPVGTVLVSVTLPALRDTHVGAGTLEGLWAAGLGLWGGRRRSSTDNDPHRTDVYIIIIFMSEQPVFVCGDRKVFMRGNEMSCEEGISKQ